MLAIRRLVFDIFGEGEAVGETWLDLARMARLSGAHQLAYSALLNAATVFEGGRHDDVRSGRMGLW